MSRRAAGPCRAGAAALLMAAAGCAAIPETERQLLVAEIDCTRADETLASLEAARPTEARKARVLASSLTPGGLLIGAATEDIRDRERVLSGDYAADIDARIALVRETCGV